MYLVTLLVITKEIVMNLIKYLTLNTYAKAYIALQPYQNLFDINSCI